MKGFILTYVENGAVTQLVQASTVQAIQRHKKDFKKDPKYWGGELQIRTIEGFKNKKVL